MIAQKVQLSLFSVGKPISGWLGLTPAQGHLYQLARTHLDHASLEQFIQSRKPTSLPSSPCPPLPPRQHF